MKARLLIVAVCVLFYWKLALTSEYIWFDHPDMVSIELPRLQFIAHEVHQGRVPLWATGIWMGQPLLGQTQPGPLFPLNILLVLLPLRNGYLDFRLLNWYFVLAHLIAALGMYALCRDLRRSRPASLLAAFGFAFAGFVGTVAWLDVINGAIWTPWLALFFLRAARGLAPWTNATLCGVVLALAWLSGHHEVPLMLSYALAAGWAFLLWRRRAALAPAALTFGLAGLIAAVQLWPTAEFARVSRRWVGLENNYGWADKLPYASPAGYSLPVKALPATFIDSANYADSSPFLGVVLMALALYGIAARWRHPAVRWATILAVAALLFAMGNNTPLHGPLFTYAPMLGKARVPVRAILLLNFALVMLAAFGFDAILARRERVWSRRASGVLTLLGLAVLLAMPFRPDLDEPTLLAGIVALAFAALLTGWRGNRIARTAFAASVTLLMVFEVYPAATKTFANKFKFAGALSANADIVEFLRREPAPRRVTYNETDAGTNFTDWHSFDGLEGYVAGVSENLLELPRHTRPIQNLYGVTHLVAKQADRPEWVEAFTGTSGLKVFRNPQALPRAWAVHEIRRTRTRPEMDALLSRDDFDPRRTALMTSDPPPVEACDGDEVTVLAHAPNRIRLRAQMQCAGLVVLAETFFEGWRAKVDGRETGLIETFGTLRGVPVPRGDHRVEVFYRPRSVYGGAALSAAGIGIAAGIIAVRWRRDRRQRRSLPRS